MAREGPLEKEVATHSIILAWTFHGQRSLADYSPWGLKRVKQDLATEQPQNMCSVIQELFHLWGTGKVD